MLITTYLISMLLTFHSVDLNNCSNNQDATITVVGRAFVNKFHAAVKTDDSLVYYLQDIYDWKKKYMGKRVKVTGTLMPILPPVLKMPGTDMTPTPRLRDGRYLKNVKWKLVK